MPESLLVFDIGFAFINTVVFPEEHRGSTNVNDPSEVLKNFGKIGYVNTENFIKQRARLESAVGKLRSTAVVDGWTVTFYHVFDTIENAEEFRDGIYATIHAENTALRGYAITPIDSRIEPITHAGFIEIYMRSVQGELAHNNVSSFN
jgi:hypothetical protein